MNRPSGNPEHLERLKRKPHLLHYYRDLLAFLDGRPPPGGNVAAAAFKLALVSEYHLLPPDGLVSRALERNEFFEFADTVFALTRAGFAFARVFLAAYGRLNLSLKKEAPLMVGLVENTLKNAPKGEQALEFVFSAGAAFHPLLEAAALVAAHTPGSLPELLPFLKRNRLALPPPEFERWLRRGCDLLSSLRVEEGVAFFKMESVSSRRMLGLQYVALRDVKTVLDIYASSLAGRGLSIVSRDVSVFGLEAPFTDGRSVFLPPTLGFFADSLRNERAYSALTAVQAATVAYGTYGFDLARITFRAELAERYGTLLPDVMENVRRQYKDRAVDVREKRTGEVEARFAGLRTITLLETQLEKFFYSFPTPDLIKLVFTLVETVRIESGLSARYPGLREDLDALNGFLWERRPEVRAAEDNSQAKFQALVEGLAQYSLAGRYKNMITDQALAEALDRAAREFDQVRRPHATVEDAALAAFLMYNILFDMFPLVSVTKRVDLRAWAGGLGVIELTPEIVADSSPDLLALADNRFTHENLTEDKERAVDLAAATTRGRDAQALKRELAGGRVKVFRYDEYDCFRSVTREKYCTLYERVLEGGDPGFFEGVLRRRRAVYQRLKKKLLNLKPEEVEFSRKWLTGDEIHLQDAVDYGIDLRRGRTPEEKIYLKKIRNRRDVAAAVLVDASSSTEERVSAERIIDVEKDAVCLLAQTLETLGDDFALYSFAGNGPRNVFFNVIKEFGDAWNRSARARIAAVSPVASNRDGCAIRHATAKLSALPPKTKLLLLLSDGIPADVGYGSDSNVETSPYAIEDTRRAILEAKRRGVVPFCLTIDREARAYINRLYGQYHYQILSDVTRLPDKLSRLYLRLTR